MEKKEATSENVLTKVLKMLPYLDRKWLKRQYNLGQHHLLDEICEVFAEKLVSFRSEVKSELPPKEETC